MVVPAFSEYRIWQTKSGQSTEAEYVMARGDKVILRTRKGKQVPIDPLLLCGEDQRYIKLQVPLKLEIKTSKEEIKKDSGRLFEGWFEEHIRVVAQVRKKSSQDYPGKLTLTILQIGEHEQSSNEAVIGKSTHEFSLPRDDSFENTTTFLKKTSTSFSIKERHYEFAGYAVYITDEFGKIIAASSSPSSYEKHGEKLLSLPTNQEFNKKFDPIDQAGESYNRVEARNPENWLYTWKNKEVGRPQPSGNDTPLFVRSKYGSTHVYYAEPPRPGQRVKMRYALTEGSIGVASPHYDEIVIPSSSDQVHTLEISNQDMVFSFTLDGNDMATRPEPLKHNSDHKPFYYIEVEKEATLKVLSIEIN
jgi:hypothetical protein